MSNINGNFNAGGDMNVANGNISIYQQTETYKSIDQMVPDELRAELKSRRQKLKADKSTRRGKAPKWLALPLLGVFLGVYFVEYSLQFLNHDINIHRIFDLLSHFVHSYPPYVLGPVIAGYLLILWALPARMILDLLFNDDEVMQIHRATIRDILLLLKQRE